MTSFLKMFCFGSFLVTTLAVLSGCASVNYERDEPSTTKSGYGIFVVGFETDDSTGSSGGLLGALTKSPFISVSKTKLSNGVYNKSLFDVFEKQADLRDGYAVLSLPILEEKERYVLSGYGESKAVGANFQLNCNNKANFVFDLKQGDVIYLGHHKLSGIKLSWSGKSSWRHEWIFEVEKARAYLDTHFPELASKLIMYPFEKALTGSLGANCK